MSSAGNFMKKMYVKRTPEMSKAIHIYSSALKATLTWQNMVTLQVLLVLKELLLCFFIPVTFLTGFSIKRIGVSRSLWTPRSKD